MSPPNKLPCKAAPPDKPPVIDPQLRISASKVMPLILPFLRRSVTFSQSQGPPRRQHHPAIVTQPQPSKVQPSRAVPDALSLSLAQAAQASHAHRFKLLPLKLDIATPKSPAKAKIKAKPVIKVVASIRTNNA